MLHSIIIAVEYVIRLPVMAFYLVYDTCTYIYYKKWRDFNLWGLHTIVGDFGGGKTCLGVSMAYDICKKYKTASVLTNLELFDFPEHTKIYKLNTIQDIIDAPNNTVVLVDEIGTLFNSRDFMKGAKDGMNKILFRHMMQVRKRKKVIFGMTQRYNFLDKQLRDVCDTISTVKMHFKDPFSRFITVYKYNAKQYEMYHDSLGTYDIMPLSAYVVTQTNSMRNLYDTEQLIDELMTKEYMQTEVDVPSILFPDDKKTKRKIKKGIKRIH